MKNSSPGGSGSPRLSRKQICAILERHYGAKAELARRAQRHGKPGKHISKSSVTKWCQGTLESENIYAAALEVAIELLKKDTGDYVSLTATKQLLKKESK